MDAPDLTPSLVGFVRTLRAAGVPASHDRLHAFASALATLSPSRRDDVYWAGRLTLCGSPVDLERYERAFAAYFGGQRPTAQRRPAPAVLRLVPAPSDTDPDAGAEDDTVPAITQASAAERLGDRDIAELSGEERAELNRLLASFSLPGETRRTRRFVTAHRGVLDRSRTVRRMLSAGGEPVRLAYQRPRERPRRVVLLVDVSGSMAAYCDALLRFAHAATRGRVTRTEVFTFGTRLTRVTVPMSLRDPDLAMREVAAAVPDWSGGTRLGEMVKAFLDRWGQRGMARGAVVVVLSDGWERGDVALLGEQMERLSRLAHRVVWANPRAGRPGFAPIAAGMAAALPHCDDLVAGHSLAALEHLARVVAGAVRTSTGGHHVTT